MKKILLGVTGSVAAIKVLELVMQLACFAEVRLVVTANADYFLKDQYADLKKRSILVYRDEDEWPALAAAYSLDAPILHIELRRWADCMVIAPLDANTLAKLAHGFCDNLLTSVFRAWDWQKMVYLCPAMNTFMWENEPTNEQLLTLARWGSIIIDPVCKQLACKDVGMGAMASVGDIVKQVKSSLQPSGVENSD